MATRIAGRIMGLEPFPCPLAHALADRAMATALGPSFFIDCTRLSRDAFLELLRARTREAYGRRKDLLRNMLVQRYTLSLPGTYIVGLGVKFPLLVLVLPSGTATHHAPPWTWLCAAMAAEAATQDDF